MKMRKSLLLLALSLLTATSVSAITFEALNDDGVTIYYKSVDSNTVQVTAKNTNEPNSYSGNVVIPAKVTYADTEYDVVGIYFEAFRDCADLISVTIPESVTYIQANAFYGCSSLTAIDIPASVTEIGNYAFYGCSSLTSLNLPDGLTEIAFSLCNSCTWLTSVTIPSGVVTIKSYAFANCSSLASISLPESIRTIECDVFVNTPMRYQSSGYWEDDAMYVGKYLILTLSDLPTDYTVKDGTIAIAENAFWGNSSLTKVTLPASLRSINGSAFSDCTALTDIELPDGLESLDGFAFSGCTSLTTATIPATVTSIGGWAFKNCTALESLSVVNAEPASIELGPDVFLNVPTSTCVLHVPVGCKALYQGLNQWKEFEVIVDGISGLGSINVDAAGSPSTPVYYDLMGRRVDHPTPGIYIRDGRKVLVK